MPEIVAPAQNASDRWAMDAKSARPLLAEWLPDPRSGSHSFDGADGVRGLLHRSPILASTTRLRHDTSNEKIDIQLDWESGRCTSPANSATEFHNVQRLPACIPCAACRVFAFNDSVLSTLQPCCSVCAIMMLLHTTLTACRFCSCSPSAFNMSPYQICDIALVQECSLV